MVTKEVVLYKNNGGVIFMTKFNYEFRVKMVREKLMGKTYKRLSQEFGVGEKTIREWVTRYKAGGMTQLVKVNKRYTADFKKAVIEYRWEHNLSFVKTAAKFGIPNSGIVNLWEKRYREQGEQGLVSKKRGRPRIVMPIPVKPESDSERESMTAR